MSVSHRPGKEVETSKVVETITLVVTRPIAGESRPFRDPQKLVILGSLSPSILALQAILEIEFFFIFTLAKLNQRFSFSSFHAKLSFKLLSEAKTCLVG